MGYQIVLWGMGKTYNYIRNTLCYHELTNQINVVCVTASELPEAEFVDGYKIVKPDNLNNVKYDYIFVLSDDYYEQIVNDAVTIYGISRDKIIRYNILLIPEINLQRYFKLYESKITILSNNCWGGIVYNTLGMECRSPLKNLFLKEKDYLKLISNPKFYFSHMPHFKMYTEDSNSSRKYPVLELVDIEIHCNHTDSSEEAIAEWNRRVRKVNYNNIFCEMYTENRKTAGVFEKLGKYDHRICFVPWDTNLQHQMKLELGTRQSYFWEAVNSNAGMGNNALTYKLIDLLLGEKNYRLT